MGFTNISCSTTPVHTSTSTTSDVLKRKTVNSNFFLQLKTVAKEKSEIMTTFHSFFFKMLWANAILKKQIWHVAPLNFQMIKDHTHHLSSLATICCFQTDTKDTNGPNISQLIPVGLQNMLILEQFLVQAGWEGSTIKLTRPLCLTLMCFKFLQPLQLTSVTCTQESFLWLQMIGCLPLSADAVMLMQWSCLCWCSDAPKCKNSSRS